MGRIYISAGHKSSGKTTLSIGLCASLSQQGKRIQPFKKGPDYIDPLWLGNASSINKPRQCYNLDFNTQSSDEIIHTLNHYGTDADISIIEGNKGLYDGVALNGSDSNAAMAKLTQSPVILVIDARGVTRGVAPLLLGYQHFDKDINIAGVIYNFCGGARHEQKLRAVTEEYTDIPVFGMLRKSNSMDLAERHLGLMPSNETKDAKRRISEIAQFVTGSVDLSKVIECADSAEILPDAEQTLIVNTSLIKTKDHIKLRIGICEDAAFGFYYADDKQALTNAGAELISINTLNDDALPNDLDGLFIGGGFPETQMKALEANESMRESIHDAIEAGLPTYAECGGLMYLSESIHWNNEFAEMVGIIPANAQMNKKPQGRGYVKLEETDDMPWINTIDNSDLLSHDNDAISSLAPSINAHEFHYSSLENVNEKGTFAFKVKRGVGITGEHDGWVYKNLVANYSHIRHTNAFPWANRFIAFIRTKATTNDEAVHKLANINED
ncbi:MAG: cobyrinate a,c-diamide synthase [Cocleimonas sp.]